MSLEGRMSFGPADECLFNLSSSQSQCTDDKEDRVVKGKNKVDFDDDESDDGFDLMKIDLKGVGKKPEPKSNELSQPTNRQVKEKEKEQQQERQEMEEGKRNNGRITEINPFKQEISRKVECELKEKMSNGRPPGVFRPKQLGKQLHHSRHNPFKSRGGSDLSAIKEKPEEEDDKSIRKIDSKNELQVDAKPSPFKDEVPKSKRVTDPIPSHTVDDDVVSFK